MFSRASVPRVQELFRHHRVQYFDVQTLLVLRKVFSSDTCLGSSGDQESVQVQYMFRVFAFSLKCLGRCLSGIHVQGINVQPQVLRKMFSSGTCLGSSGDQESVQVQYMFRVFTFSLKCLGRCLAGIHVQGIHVQPQVFRKMFNSDTCLGSSVLRKMFSYYTCLGSSRLVSRVQENVQLRYMFILIYNDLYCPPKWNVHPVYYIATYTKYNSGSTSAHCLLRVSSKLLQELVQEHVSVYLQIQSLPNYFIKTFGLHWSTTFN